MPNQIQGNYRTTYDEEVQKRMDVPLCGDDTDLLQMGIALIPGDAQVLEDHPSLEKDKIRDTDNGSYELPSLITNDKVMLWAIPDGLDYGPLLVDYKNATEAMEKAFVRHMGPGDEPLKEFADAMIFNPAKRVQEGWTSVKLINRLNPGAWYKEFGAYMNGGVSEEARKKFAWGDAHFPINRLVVSMDKIVGIHTDYFKKADNGTITAEEERNFRQALLEEEIRALHYLNRVATLTDPEEGERIKELAGVGNAAQEFNRYGARGIRMTYADTEARIAGLKAGWPIEDLNALSSFKHTMDLMYTKANYSHITTSPKLKDRPDYLPGQQEYLGKMQELWAKIESTPVRDNETRKALLTEMRELVREGVEKKFIDTKDLNDGEPEFSYALYDIDRKLARQLTPAETEVMLAGNGIDADRIGIVEQEEQDADRRRREEYEARERQEREEREFREALNAVSPEEQQKQIDRLEVDPAGRIWFYDILEEKRRQALKTTPVNMNTRPTSDQNNILRYQMAKKDLTFDQALDLQLEGPEERRQMAEDYYDDLIDHPIVGVPEEEAARNARYLGELDNAGINKMLAEPLPYFDPTDPEQVKNYAKGSMGRLAAFTMDFGQNITRLRDMQNPSSPVRRGYASAFGSREDYARIHGQAMIPNTLGEIAVIVNNEGFSPLQRAVALHFLQTKHAEIAGRPLSELPADKWIDIRATANGVLESLPDFPTNGAPTDREIQLFLEGRAPSPFSEDYLKQFDARINAVKGRITAYGDDPAANHRIEDIDMARVYNLDYISQRQGAQPLLGPDGFAKLTPEQAASTRQIFEHTLGNYISTTEMQPTLAVMKGESVYDRFTVGGVKATEMMRNTYGDLYDFLTPEQRETATEAELLKALADPTKQVAFTPLTGGPNGTVIDRQPPIQIPHPAPQRTAENPIQPPDADARFEASVSQAIQGAKKLDGILPGAFNNLGPDYLDRKLAQAQDPAQVQHEKRDFLRGFAQAGDMLSGMIAEQAPDGGEQVPGLSDYVKLQADRVRRAEEQPGRQDNLPYASLMGMVDQIHLPEAGAVDHRQPGPVFRDLADHPTGADPFPVVDAAKRAQHLMDRTAQYVDRTKDTAHPVTAEEDLQARKDLLADITTLEGQLDDMERVSGTRRRGRQVAQAFDGEDTVRRFVKGNPGLNTVRAELDGRRKALVQGWPVEDTDLIAGIYAKRDVINRALQTMPRGTDQYMAYARAGRALNEICDTLDNAIIDSPEKRSEILNTIDSYGPAIYNDIVAKAGAPEAGQTAAFKESVQRAKNAQIAPASFKSMDDSLAVGDEAFRLIQERNRAAEERAVQRQQLVSEARRQAREQAREAREARLREEQEDNEMGERLYREGLFDEVAEGGAEAEQQAAAMDFVGDIFGQVQEARDRDRRFAEEDRIRREREDRQEAYRQNDANDMGYQSFDDLFATGERKAVSAFEPNDEYIHMLDEDGKFFGDLFEKSGSHNYAGEDLYGNDRVFGFFEWEDINTRLKSFSRTGGKDLNVKTDRLPSVTNDMRAYLMAEHGMSFEEAYALNTADLKERREYAQEYLAALETHPLNADMTAEQREESATYYGSMHREAMDRFTDAPFPEMDLSDHEALKKIAFGPSMLRAANHFSVDLTRDSQSLFLGSYPEVRAAYVDALGGPESYERYHEQLSLIQAVGIMAQVAAEPVNPYSPLRNKAYAKFELERLNETMKGKKLSDMPDGLGYSFSEAATQMLSSPIPAEGAPTDEQLQAYLEGRIPSPFSNDYIARVDAQLRAHTAASSRGTVQGTFASEIRENLGDKTAVYDLPYIPAGPEAPRPRPDYYAMSGKDLHDTHVTFDRIFGKTLNAQSNGQLRMAVMRGEEIHDRFRIDGKKVSEIPELQDSKNSRTPEEFRIIMESEILQAMGDPKRKVEYVPLSVSENGAPREEAPVEISKASLTFEKDNYDTEPIQKVNTAAAREVVSLSMGYGQLSCQVTTVEGLREGKYFDPMQATDILDDRTVFPEPGEDEIPDGEMGIGTGKYTSYNHMGGYSTYRTIRGLKKDGTLTKEGENNLRKLKDDMNEQYRQMQDLATEWDAKDPMLAEMIRISADGAATSETAPTWFDLSRSFSYRNITSQIGTIHLGHPTPDKPMNQIEAMQAIQGYPNGRPVFPLPHAMSAVHRETLAECRHAGSQEAGTLSRMQDRLTRRMMLAEMDQAEKHLRRIDEIIIKSRDIKNPEAMQVAHFDRFLDNSVLDSSSFHARGTKHVHSDMNGRRALMAQGWPVDDLNLLAHLYMRREETRDTLNNPNYPEETRERSRRANKVLNEICDYLEKTEIRNEQDREKALAHINSYGDLLYNPTAMGGPGKAVDYRQRFAEMRAKKPLAHEFLSDEERREYRESYEQFKAQAGSATLTPTVNGPQTDMERAFLNVENIAVLAEAQGQMEADPEIAKDPVLAEARHQTELFLAEVDQFYRNRQLLDPENADKRQESFEKLLSDSTTVVDALEEAEQKLTNEGKKTSFTPAEEKMLKEIRHARAGVDEMRRKYSARIDFELQRKEELEKIERREAEREDEAQRYMVDLDYAMLTLSEEEQERLMRILNEQRDVQQRFDFATGEMIPAGDLPERIAMTFDDDGNLRPQALVFADKQDREREIEAQEAEQERRDAIRAERTAKRETVPYEEGAADLFEAGDQAFEAQNKEAEKIRERLARNREGERRRDLADRTGDERYEWSFAHILRDAGEKKQAAEKARDDAANDPATTDARMVELIERARESRYVSEEMEKAVIFSYDVQSIDREIERRWPQIYKDSYQPKIESWGGTAPNASDAKAMTARMRALQALPAKDRYEIMGRLAENLAPAQREELRSRLVGIKAPLSVPYTQQVTKPLHDRIEELKKQKTPANTIGVPLVPERIGAYHEALDYADQVLDEAGEDQISYGTMIANERENTVNQLRTKQIDREIAKGDDNFRLMSAAIKSNRTSVLEEGVLSSQEGALQEIVGRKEEHSPEYIRSLGRLMSRMEEMGIDPAAQAEQTVKFYAFSDLAKAKLDLKNAIQDGDPERVIEAKQSYEKWRGNMQELVGYAKEHFSPDSAPGNVDTRRNPAVPWEFSGEYTATSQVNGAYQLYSALKQTGVTVQEFVEDHDAAMRRMFAKLDERNSYKEQFKEKSIGTALGTMMAEDGDLEGRRLIRAAQENQMVLRGDEMLVEGDPDAARRAQNRATRSLMMAHRNLVTRVRETHRNPFTRQDETRKKQVLGLLSVVSEEDLHADYDRMVCGTHFDAQGRKVAPITAEQYIANKQNIDYTKLGDRGADIIRDALAVPGTTFDPVAFMEERQKALSSMLLTRAADAGKPGFDRLEYETTHMEEAYDMIRVSNPKMPELTEEQRQRFRAAAAQYEEKRKQVQKNLTGEQKNRIAGRRRNAGNIARKARADLLSHEAQRNAQDGIRRYHERNRQAQENARRQQQEQQRLAGERIRQQEAQVRAELETELLRQKEAPALEQRRMANDSLTLTGQFRTVYGLMKDAEETKRAAKRRNPQDPVEIRDAIIGEQDAQERCNRMLHQMIRASQGDPDITRIPAAQMRVMLREVLDDRRTEEILAKIPQGVGHYGHLDDLSIDERAIVVGVIAGSIDPKERDRIIAEDDAYIPISRMDLKGSPFAAGQDPEEQERIRTSYETHMADHGPQLNEIRDFRAEVQNTGLKYAGTRKERSALMADLDYAERMMRPSAPGARNSLMMVVNTRDQCDSDLRKTRLAEDHNRAENRYMNDLMEQDPGARYRVFRPRADKSQDIRKLKSEKLSFSPEYTNAVAGMLRKMEQMHILTADAVGEEGTKVYAFHQLVKAQDELMEAVRSKDREKISQATAKLKEVRKGMDELMQTARDNFHPSEYMSNLDVVRNDQIPWDYARDVVPSSQINSIYLFGSALKRNGISVDEFERDPGAAIQKLEKLGEEKGNSMKGLCTGKSAGVLAAQAATGTFPFTMQSNGSIPHAAYMRGVGGLILADPGKDPGMRRRNDLVYQQIHDFNVKVNNYRVDTSKLLKNGFDNKSERGRDAVRTLMLVDVGEADFDRMFADPPVSPEGLPVAPVTLADYISGKKEFDYTAQAGHLEEMLTDAARETARLSALKEQGDAEGLTPVYLSEFSQGGFNPYEMLQARQEALTQLLVMRAKDKDQPGFQALEEELRHLPERYEALRSANPDLNLPALTQDQKTMLKSGAKAYDDLTINRAKTLEAEEKRIVKAEADKEKTFNRTLKDLNKTVKRRKEQLDKLVRRGASPEEIDAAEEAYTNAYDQRETLKKGRAQAIVEDYKAGKLPEAYASAKLQQLAEMNARGNEPLQTLPVFGAPERSAGRERLRQESREKLLTQSILAKQGIRLGQPTHAADSMLQSLDALGIPEVRVGMPQAQPVPQPHAQPMQPAQPPVQEAPQNRAQLHNIEPQLEEGQNINALAEQMPNADAMIEDEIDEVRQEVPQNNGPKPPQQKAAKDDGPIKDKSFADLEKKLLGDKPQPEHHQRRNSVGGPGARPKMEEQAVQPGPNQKV